MNRRRERPGCSGGVGLRSSSERPVSHRAELHKESAPRVKSQLDVEAWQLHQGGLSDEMGTTLSSNTR
jgi:hypothetical protein